MSVTFYRDRLRSEQAKLYYDTILQILSSDSPREQIPLPVQERENASKDAIDALRAVRKDHPEIFFLSLSESTSVQDGQFLLLIPFLYSVSQISRMRAYIDKRLRYITLGVQDLPLWEREKVIYERVRRMLVYENNGRRYDHNIVGPLLRRSGVCEGFTTLLILAMRMVGIPCIYVLGKTYEAKEINHCWNMVWLGEKTYHLDITWEYLGKKGEIGFSYFNLTDEQIARDHETLTEGLPECNDPTFGYHSYTHTLFTTENELTEYLQQAFQKSNGPFSIRMNGKQNVQDCVCSALGKLPGGLY